jgi:hypothetical protein
MNYSILPLLFALFVIGVPVSAQLGPVDMAGIKAQVSDSGSVYFYPKLLKRYVELDTTLTELEYRLVYYGYAFQENYVRNEPDLTRLGELVKAGDHKGVIREAAAVLKKNPFVLQANNAMGYALFSTEKEKGEWTKYRDRYFALRRTIAYSGDGLSAETAFVVLYAEDEYEMMYDYFKIPRIHKQTCCDVFEIQESDRFRASKIYFDISPSLMRQQQILEGDK